MSIERLGQHFIAVEDPRCSGKVEHRLVEVLVVAVCAVIACAESWDDIALHGRSKLVCSGRFWNWRTRRNAKRLRRHLIARPFRRVFMLIDLDAF